MARASLMESQNPNLNANLNTNLNLNTNRTARTKKSERRFSVQFCRLFSSNAANPGKYANVQAAKWIA